MAGFSVESSNITAETTLQEMLESIQKTLKASLKTKSYGTWKWSFTGRGAKIDECENCGSKEALGVLDGDDVLLCLRCRQATASGM